MTSAIEARHRLDKTLSSSALSDPAILSSLVRKQLLKTSSEKSATDEVVKKKSNQLLKLLDALRSAKGERSTKVVDGEWKVKQDTPRFRVMYREGPEGAPYHSLCLDGIIDGPMSHALVVGWEVPMYKEWWPQFAAPTFKITESRWLERDTVGGDHSVLRFKVPWPFAMREVILSGYELEYFDEDLVAVLYNSAPDVPDEKVDGISSDQIPELHSHAVRMDLDGGFVLQKIGHNCNFFRIVVDLDMKLDLVPPWLINFIARQLVGHGYKLYQKAVSGVEGSLLEKLVNTDPMYKRIQALDSMSSLNPYEPKTPSEQDLAGSYKGPYKQEETDSFESAFKSLSDQGVSNPVQENQLTLRESNFYSNNAAISNGLSNDKREVNPNESISRSQTNGSEIVTLSLEPEQQLRPPSDEDRASDPEVVWALEVIEKLIAHFKNQNTASETGESSGVPSVQNGIADNPEPVRSMAQKNSDEYLDTQEDFPSQKSALEHTMRETKVSLSTAAPVNVTGRVCITNGNQNGKGSAYERSPLTGEFVRVKGAAGSDKANAVVEVEDFIPPPRRHHRGLRFFRFGKRRKNKEELFSKWQDKPAL